MKKIIATITTIFLVLTIAVMPVKGDGVVVDLKKDYDIEISYARKSVYLNKGDSGKYDDNIEYDGSTKTLTLNNTQNNQLEIFLYNDSYNVNIIGENVISYIGCENALNINGSGKISSIESIYGDNITISNLSIDKITSEIGGGESLTINNSSIDYVNIISSYNYFKEEYGDVSITNSTIKDNNSIIGDNVNIDKSNIISKEIVTYSSLNIKNNSTVDTSHIVMKKSSNSILIDDSEVEVNSGSNYNLLECSGSLTINDSNVKINSSNTSGIGVTGSLAIKNSTIEVKGKYAYIETSDTLTVENKSNIEVIGDSSDYICSEKLMKIDNSNVKIGHTSMAGESLTINSSTFTSPEISAEENVTISGVSYITASTGICSNEGNIVINPDKGKLLEVKYGESNKHYIDSPYSEKTTLKDTELANFVCQPHTHTGGNPSCNKVGICSDCGKEYYIDHKIEKVEANNATCDLAGNEEYYVCSVCGKLYSDDAGTKEITKIPVINAKGHNLTKTEKVDATCDKDGNIEYYYCDVCDKYFSDKEGKTEIAKDDIVIKAKGHILSKVSKVEPTTTTVGYKEHYKCSVCGKLFSDEAGTIEVTLKDLEISMIVEDNNSNITKDDTKKEDIKTTIKEETTKTTTKKETSKTTTEKTKTNDNNNITLYSILILVAGGLIIKKKEYLK